MPALLPKTQPCTCLHSQTLLGTGGRVTMWACGCCVGCWLCWCSAHPTLSPQSAHALQSPQQLKSFVSRSAQLTSPLPASRQPAARKRVSIRNTLSFRWSHFWTPKAQIRSDPKGSPPPGSTSQS